MADDERPVSDASDAKRTGRVLLGASAQTLLDVLHFVFGFLGWTVRWTGATLFFLAVMAGAGYYVFTQAVQGGEHVMVPDVTGLPVTRASNVLAEAGLELGDQSQVVSERVPPFHVIVQRPSANRVVRAGRKVSLTISAGTELETTPGFIGKQLAAAIEEIETTRLRAGSIARIPHVLPADTVLAQDPEPLRSIEAGGEIHLLVSEGPGRKEQIMPELVGKSLEEAQIILANLNVKAVPFSVERPGAEYETILTQNPAPGSRLNPDQEVSFEVRLLPTSYLPNIRHKVTAEYVVPNIGGPVAIRVDQVDSRGERTLLFPLLKDFRDGRPPRLEPGSRITLTDLVYTGSMTVEFYVENSLHKTYSYESGGDAVVTEHAIQPNFQSGGQRRFIQQEDLGGSFQPPPTDRRFPRRRFQ